MIGGVVIDVYIVVVQGETVRPRATIIGVEDNEVDYLSQLARLNLLEVSWRIFDQKQYFLISTF